MMQAGCWIQDHVPGGQLYTLSPIRILDDKFASIVFTGICEKQGGGNDGPNARSAAAYLTNCVVHVGSERLASGVAVKQRRKDLQGKRRGDEQRIPPQRVQHDI